MKKSGGSDGIYGKADDSLAPIPSPVPVPRRFVPGPQEFGWWRSEPWPWCSSASVTIFFASGLETAFNATFLAIFLAALAGAVTVAFWRFTRAVGFVFSPAACCCSFRAFQRSPGLRDIGTRQIGITQQSVEQVGLYKMCSRRRGESEIGTNQVGSIEVAVLELCPCKISF
jgi:hypothetical protein